MAVVRREQKTSTGQTATGRGRPAGLGIEPEKRRNSIIGIRMPQEREAQVKSECARRGISIATLFAEMWESYQASPPKK